MIVACSLAVAAHAQVTVIDPLNGDSLSGYTSTLVLDNSLGAGQGVSFSDSSGSLVASYVGTGTSAEQALFLAPANSFSTTFSVGDMLTVNASLPSSSVVEDFGLAIAALANPTAAGSGNSYNSRGTFDWASISIRPSQTAIRVNTSISGTVTTSGGVLSGVSPTSVSKLFIAWNSADTFTLGYFSGSTQIDDETVTFANGSNIGSAIGFYGDLRATGTSLGSFADFSIQPAPEPSTLALCGMGALAGIGWWRRRA